MAVNNNKEMSSSSVDKAKLEELAHNVLTNMSKKELEDTEGDVLCKMVIKGKASSLTSILGQIMSAYYRSSGNYTKGFDTNLKLTLMIQKGETETETK